MLKPKVVDRFTVRDGRWEVDPRPYGLTASKLYQYGGHNIPGKGGATQRHTHQASAQDGL